MGKLILPIFGARPGAITMGSMVPPPEAPSAYQTKVAVAPRQGQIVDQGLDILVIQPGYDLEIMLPDQNLIDF
jgi:UDP-N-acetylglucosamine 2-epimerase (non-hydrolysing)